ncbi:MAG: bifunctional phosphopantothenoylcysteine decarboxylase/phosphopantothenate--cysteine ligase CoaBC [Xanthomonadales bacterium]|nr:bifunctional phosphopantothenoylcysteine decarboxylase/phosphopantothenate--cysteine ligase CoaBC [Xanthomonadales bacterium]
MSEENRNDTSLIGGQRILLGVTGGIAAYKAADLVRRLRDAGAEVRVVMTSGAQAFVTPLTFQAVSGHRVHTRLLDEDAEAGMGHIELARWADRILVAPATADFMARLAHGLAPDLLGTICLASAAPIILAPAMNQQMWANSTTQANTELLRGRGIEILGPGTGEQACGDIGPGRMLEPADIVAALAGSQRAVLAGRSVLITAGPTFEDVDPVRFIGNRSSGKMGFALARAARAAGARVTLIAGPCALTTPEGVERIDVRSAEDMHAAVMDRVADFEIFIAVAAVADYTPARPVESKMKKGLPRQRVDLVATRDIVAEVAALDPRPYTVGFAAETDNVAEYAKDKLLRKGLDMIAANRVGQAGTGFSADENEILLLVRDRAGEGLDADGERHLGTGSKQRLAARIIDEIAREMGEGGRFEDRSDQDTRPASGQ